MKIQVLELPTEYVGDVSKTPYALIVSECLPDGVAGVSEAMKALKDIKPEISWFLVTDEQVEV